LVIKGLQENSFETVETTTEEEQQNKTHQKPKTGGFLSSWLEKGIAWLNDDDMKDF